MPINIVESSYRVAALALLACGALAMVWPNVSAAGGKDDALFAKDYFDLSQPDGAVITKEYRLTIYQSTVDAANNPVTNVFPCNMTRSTTFSTSHIPPHYKTMTTSSDGCLGSWTDETIYVPREGFYWTKDIIGTNTRTYDPPLLVMPDKFYPGDTWGGSSLMLWKDDPSGLDVSSGLHIETRTALGLEDLTIQDEDGTRSFRNCLKARHDRTSQGATARGMTRIRWYCPGTGWVREDRINDRHQHHDLPMMIGRSEVLMP